MAHYESSRPNALGFTPSDVLTLASGMILFGAMMMMLLGCFHFIVGLAAVLDDNFYSPRVGYAFNIDTTLWGWLHMGGGILMVVVSFAVISGSSLARMLAVLIVAVSAVWNFYSIPIYPIWSLMMLALDLGVLWALLVRGKEFTAMMNDSVDAMPPSSYTDPADMQDPRFY